MSDDIFSLGHLWVARSPLTLTEIEARLREEGSDQDTIDSTLAFIVLMREELAKREDGTHKQEQRPS